MTVGLTAPWETRRLVNSPDATWPNSQMEALQKGQILTGWPDQIRGDLQKAKSSPIGRIKFGVTFKSETCNLKLESLLGAGQDNDQLLASYNQLINDDESFGKIVDDEKRNSEWFSPFGGKCLERIIKAISVDD